MQDNNVQKLAEELIAVKQSILQLQEKEKALKEMLMPHIKNNGAIKSNGNMIYYAESKGARTFVRTKVLAYLTENFGQELADQIDENCTNVGEPAQRVYVKLNMDNDD